MQNPPEFTTEYAPSLPPLPPSSSNLAPEEPGETLVPLVGRTGPLVRPGWQSSELWLTVAGMGLLTAVALVGLAWGRLSGVVFAVLVFAACVVGPVVYVGERGMLKDRALALEGNREHLARFGEDDRADS